MLPTSWPPIAETYNGETKDLKFDNDVTLEVSSIIRVYILSDVFPAPRSFDVSLKIYISITVLTAIKAREVCSANKNGSKQYV